MSIALSDFQAKLSSLFSVGVGAIIGLLGNWPATRR
jgi:hypothetical protein